MKLCTYRIGASSPEAGLVIDGQVYSVPRTLKAFSKRIKKLPVGDFSSLMGIVRAGEPAFNALRHLQDLLDGASGGKGSEPPASARPFPLDRVTLMAPLPRPTSIRDFLVFEDHLVNATHTVARQIFPPAAWLNTLMRKTTGRPLLRPPKVWYEMPTYYKGNPDTVIGPGEAVLWPSYTEKLDFELEFGLYILKAGKNIPASGVRAYIAGYTIFNYMSARDIQLREMKARLGPAKGKDFDTGNIMGPFLVTPDEVEDPYSLRMEAFVNGERWSDGNSSGMRFSFEEIIEHVSRDETIQPGDFIGSGTVGNGCGLELDLWIKPGDVITLKVEELGELTNPVIKK